MSQELYDFCIDEYLEGESFDPALLPDMTELRSASHDELVLARHKLWQPGQTLRIFFLDGSNELHAKVEGFARTWLQFANLEFVFGPDPDAEIRVTFNGNRFASLVGTDALKRPFPQFTMILGGLTVDNDETLLRRVVLHEFGHAIGCNHEQGSPDIRIPWDEEKVITFYKNRVGWDEDTIRRNVLRRYNPEDVIHSDHDRFSIMQYPVDNELTIGDFVIGWNTVLSGMDKDFIGRAYPFE